MCSLKSSLKSYFDELNAGLKQTKRARVYSGVLLTRRIFFAVWLLGFRFLDSIYLVAVMAGIQVFYTCILTLRPYERFQSNLIEILNEMFYCVLVGGLLKYNQESEWSVLIADVYIWVMMGNNAIIAFIMTGKYHQKSFYGFARSKFNIIF